MAEMYAKMITNGEWTLDRVPARWRAQVEMLLQASTIDINSEADIPIE